MRKIKNVLIVILLICSMLILFSSSKEAASATINATSSVEVGTPITISVSGSGVQWNLKLLVNGTQIAQSQELENYENNKNISFSGSYTPTSEGTLTVELQGSVTEFDDGSTITSFASKSISVIAAPTPTPTPTPEEPTPPPATPTPEQTPTPTPVELKFTDDSKNIYVKGDNTNLRSNWATTEGAIQVKAGTELHLTGVSAEKVDGYTWYRVTYDGKIRYVRSDMVTETKPEEQTKSSNLNIKKFEIEGVELKPKFSNSVTSYSAELLNFKDKKLNVIVEPEDTKTTVKIEGNDNIKFGENTIVVTLKAEDDTTKKYTITITNKEDNTVFGLSKLNIKNSDLQGFRTDKYEYSITFKDLEKLEIEAVATDAEAKVEIVGNEKLKDGENTIVIKVTSKDRKNTVTYKIKAEKIAATDSKTEGKTVSTKSILIYGLIGVGVLIVIVVILIIYKKHKNKVEYGDNYYDDEEENDETQNVEELPKYKKDTEFAEDTDMEEKLEKIRKENIIANNEENDFDTEETKKGRGKHS